MTVKKFILILNHLLDLLRFIFLALYRPQLTMRSDTPFQYKEIH